MYLLHVCMYGVCMYVLDASRCSPQTRPKFSTVRDLASCSAIERCRDHGSFYVCQEPCSVMPLVVLMAAFRPPSDGTGMIREHPDSAAFTLMYESRQMHSECSFVFQACSSLPIEPVNTVENMRQSVPCTHSFDAAQSLDQAPSRLFFFPFPERVGTSTSWSGLADCLQVSA